MNNQIICDKVEDDYVLTEGSIITTCPKCDQKIYLNEKEKNAAEINGIDLICADCFFKDQPYMFPFITSEKQYQELKKRRGHLTEKESEEFIKLLKEKCPPS